MPTRPLTTTLLAAILVAACSEPAPTPLDSVSPSSTAAGAAANSGAGATGNMAAGATGNMAAGATGNMAAGATGNMAAGATGNMAAGAAPNGGTGAGTGGGGMVEPETMVEGPSYAATVEPIFSASCTLGGSCHMGATSLGGVGGFDMTSNLDLNMGAGYAGMVGVASTQLASMKLVGDSLENSYLWHKLNDTQTSVGGSGILMPYGMAKLPQADLDAVQAWIEGGAAP